MFKPRLIASVVMTLSLLLVTLAPAALAQAEDTAPQPLAHTSGTGGQPAQVVQAEVTDAMPEDADGQFVVITEEIGSAFIDIPVEFDDQRLSGLLTIVANGGTVQLDDDLGSIELREYRIVNDDGAWAGPGMFAHAGPADSPFDLRQQSALLTGEGAYEGLVAYLTLHPQTGTENTMEAVILAVELPPAPEPISAE